MIEKTKFKKFVSEIIKNNLDKNYNENDTSVNVIIDQLYQEKKVTAGTHSGFLTGTFATIEQVQNIVDMDQQETLMAGEVKSVDSIWTNELLKLGVNKQKAAEIVDKYSFDFINVIQEDD